MLFVVFVKIIYFRNVPSISRKYNLSLTKYFDTCSRPRAGSKYSEFTLMYTN